jgi:hypothetical protein
MRRCPYEKKRFPEEDFVEFGSFLVHMKHGDLTTPIAPIHEAISGRRLEPDPNNHMLFKLIGRNFTDLFRARQ